MPRCLKNSPLWRDVSLILNPELIMLKSLIRTVPHYPHQGIMFRDITTLLRDPQGFQAVIDQLTIRYKDTPIDVIAGIEARGFILGAALAFNLKKGFVPIRKKGKLPGKTISQSYDLEYGSDTIEIHDDAIESGACVLLIDDLIATGGSICQAARVLKEKGAKDIYVGATHPVLCGAAAEKLANAPIKEIAVTDTIPLNEHAKSLSEKIKVLSVSSLLGEAIKRIHTNTSISSMFTEQ